MKRSVNITWAEVKVGLVVMAGFVIFILAILSFGTLRSFFVPRSLLEARFSEVKGIKAGAPVWLSGVEVGNVRGIQLAQEDRPPDIRVIMEIDASMREMIRRDATASIRTEGLLGDQYIEISMGSPSAPRLPAGATLQGKVPIGIMDLVSGSSETLGEMTQFLKRAGNVTSDEILKFIQSLNTVTMRLTQGEGTAGRLINDPSIYNAIKDLAGEGQILLKKLEEDRGTVNRLLENPELYDRLSAAAGSLEIISTRIERGEGALGKLLASGEVYDHLNRAAERLDRLMVKVDSGQGVAGELVQDQELAKEIRGLVGDARALLGDMKQNPHRYFKMSLF